MRGSSGGGFARQATTMVNLLRDPKGGAKLAAAHCDLAVALAGRLGMSERVVMALGQMYERFDGKGSPAGLRGEQIPLPARILGVAWRAEVQRALLGPVEAAGAIAGRAGSELDPQVAAAFLSRAPELLAALDAPSIWDAFLAAEPQPFELMTPERTGEVALAFAHYVDIKSPFTLGHSTGVARVAEAAARHAGFADADRESLRLAALLHDVGRVSVPNGIWDKPGPLNAAEWERVRLHPYYTERILSRSTAAGAARRGRVDAPRAGGRQRLLQGRGGRLDVAAGAHPGGVGRLPRDDGGAAAPQGAQRRRSGASARRGSAGGPARPRGGRVCAGGRRSARARAPARRAAGLTDRARGRSVVPDRAGPLEQGGRRVRS